MDSLTVRGADRVETQVPAEERPALLRAMVAATGGSYPPDELAAAIDIESDWDTAAENSKTHAVGLIQIMPFHLRKWGLTVEDVRNMDWREQMRLVNRYWAGANALGRWRFPGDTYVVLAGPKGLGKPDSFVVYPVGSDGWRNNPAWREGKDGPVTSGSLRQLLQRWMAAHPTDYGDIPYRNLPSQPEPPPQPKPRRRQLPELGALGWGLVALVVLAAVDDHGSSR